jgi:hypothetical protein
MKTVGALWRKEGKKSNYYTGTLDLGVLGQINIGIFQNEKAEGDEKKPDARVVIFDDKKE